SQESRTVSVKAGMLTHVRLSPDGKLLATVSRRSQQKAKAGEAFVEEPQEIKVWDAATGQENHRFKRYKGHINDLAFRQDGMQIAVAFADGVVRVLESMTGETSLAFQGDPSGVASVSFSPDGKRLATLPMRRVEIQVFPVRLASTLGLMSAPLGGG